jgi:prepilin signal peptidase PulO-like enzyme (type II secretory pathway)
MPSLPGGLDPLIIVLGLVGAVWGAVADRIGARWPAHEDGSIRKVDWRTAVVIVFGVVALAVVPARFDDTPQRLLFGAFFAALVLLMATDLDQRLLPNEITLPLIAIGLAVLVWGGDSLINRSAAWTVIAGAVVVPALLYLASLPFGAGAFGIGDVKLLAGSGLLLGLVRLIYVVVIGAVLGGVVIVALLLVRRITLKSYVPFGPFLIAAIVWATLLPGAS